MQRTAKDDGEDMPCLQPLPVSGFSNSSTSAPTLQDLTQEEDEEVFEDPETSSPILAMFYAEALQAAGLPASSLLVSKIGSSSEGATLGPGEVS